MRSRIYFLFLLISLDCFSQERDVQLKINYYTAKVQSYLDKEKALSGFYSIDESGIKIYASPQNKSMQQPEFTLDWGMLEYYKTQMEHCSATAAFEMYKSGKYNNTVPCLIIGNALIDKLSVPEEKKLQGLKIAIDPGHIANDLATGELEKKHLKFKSLNRNTADSIEIAEGMLTYATAQLLKVKLEAAGAQTFITRVNGASALGKTYEQWKKDDLKNVVDSLFQIGEIKAARRNYLLNPKTPDRAIFWSVFKDLELAKRAELINDYHPDFTIIIHYNVDETNTGWTKPGNKDFNMTFVGGAFMKDNLSNPEKRFEFLRLLITDDLEQSISLSSSVIGSFEKTLSVPTAAISDAKYLAQGCLPTKTKGVYCRNLQLTRYVHSPLVYGETLYQDNVTESQALSKESDKTKNERVQQVAEAYYEGILNYVNQKNK